MGTEIATATPRLTRSMSPQQIQEHRATIAFEVEVVLDGFWKTMPPPEIKAGILADWCDTLQEWTREQIVWGLRKWRNGNPDKRPNPGHILALMKDARGRKVAASLPKPSPAPERKRPTPEEASAILAAVGYAPRKME